MISALTSGLRDLLWIIGQLYSFLAVAALIVATGMVVAIVTLALGYHRFRGLRVVKCPETYDFASVELNAMRAAITGIFGKPDLRLKACSSWPGRANCDRTCVQQIESAPDKCIPRNFFEEWYRDKRCASCGQELGEIEWSDLEPALLSPLGDTVEWHRIAPEKLPGVLGTHLPICWHCQIQASVRPELVANRYGQEPRDSR